MLMIPAARVHLSPSLSGQLVTAHGLEPPTIELTTCDLRRAPNEGLRCARFAAVRREGRRDLGELWIVERQPFELARLAASQGDDA